MRRKLYQISYEINSTCSYSRGMSLPTSCVKIKAYIMMIPLIATITDKRKEFLLSNISNFSNEVSFYVTRLSVEKVHSNCFFVFEIAVPKY